MPTLPGDSEFTELGVQEGTFKSKFTQALAYLRGLLGDDGLSSTARVRLGMGGTVISYTNRGNWTTATLYHVNDLALQSGVVYVAQVEHTAGTFATDLAAGKWTIHQGITREELSAPTGASLVMFRGPDGTAQPETLESIFDQMINPWRWMTEVQRNDVAGRVGSVDVLAAFNKARDYAAARKGCKIVLPIGIAKLSAPWVIDVGSTLVQGPSQGIASSNDYGACVLRNMGASGKAAIVLDGDLDDMPNLPIGTILEGFSIINMSKNNHGVLIDNGSPGGYQWNVTLNRMAIGGGDIGVYMRGDNTFNIYLRDMEIGYFVNVADAGSELERTVNYAIKSEIVAGLGICSEFERVRSVYVRKNHIFIDQNSYVIKCKSCTLESSGQSSVRVKGAGLISFDNCHWEACGHDSYWNGTYIQRSASDTVPIAIVEVGTDPAVNESGVTAFIGGTNTPNSRQGGVEPGVSGKELPIISTWTGGVSLLGPSSYGTPGLVRGQNYVRRNGYEGYVVLEDGGVYEGMAAGVLPVAGSARSIQVGKVRGLGNFPFVSQTSVIEQLGNEWTPRIAAICQTLAPMGYQAGTAVPTLGIPGGRMLYSPTWTDFTGNVGGSYNLWKPYKRGDVVRVDPTAGSTPWAYACIHSTGETTFDAANWKAINVAA